MPKIGIAMFKKNVYITNDFALGIGVVLGGFLLLLHRWLIRSWMLDDAFVFFRYAENFVQGHGWVFNNGERVEGYTSFLWLFLLTLVRSLGLEIVSSAQALGFLWAFLTIGGVAFSHRWFTEINSKMTFFSILFLTSCGVFTPWPASGMEVSFFAFLLTMYLFLFLKVWENGRPRQSLFLGFWGILCLLTRPEFFLVYGVTFLMIFFSKIKNKKIWFAFLAPFFVLYLPYFIWRYNFYGYLVPNTFFVKVGTSYAQVERGFDYSFRFFKTTLPFWIPIFCGLIFFWRAIPQKIKFLCAILLIYTATIIILGGDVMPAYRFFAPLMPILALLSAYFSVLIFKEKKDLVLWVVILLFFNFVQWFWNPAIGKHIANDKVALYGKMVGEWLYQNMDREAILATNTAGSIPYYSKLKTVDMLGLNDKHIAHSVIPTFGRGAPGHEKGNGPYVLLQQPDLIQFGSSLGSPSPVFVGDHEIFNSPSFKRDYSLVQHTLQNGLQFSFYSRDKKNEITP